MADERDKGNNSQLVAEVTRLRQRVAELETALAERSLGEDSADPLRADHLALVRNAAYGICVIGVDDRFRTVNPALAEMLGYDTEQDLLSVRPSDLCENRVQWHNLISASKGEERIEGLEVCWRRKDGTPITARLSGCALPGAVGATRGFELIVEDVTHQRRLEDQLRQAQKMEAVGRLTGGIAHDFNSILTIILTDAESLRQVLPADAVGAREDLDNLKAAAESGAAMIKKLLGFSRNGKLELREVDLPTLVRDMTAMLGRLMPDGVEISTTIDESVGLIRGDPSAIEQVFLNLVTNARDAMPDGGRLQVQVGPQTLDSEYCSAHPWVKQGTYACLSVSDSGVGMDEETRQKVFEPFFTTKPTHAGTGLGMSMVYGLVKQHGGFVHVYSELDHGTVVKVHFPEVGVRPHAASRCVSYESGEQSGSATILLTEDETALRRAAKRVLEGQGYSVLVAADGEEALATLNEHQSEIDLVISDLVMPRLGGAELYKMVRMSQPDVRFIMTSGFTPNEMKQRTSIDPGVPCLQKPWTVTELLWSVRDALEGGVGEAA